MAFPQAPSITETFFASNTTSHLVAMPASTVAGNLLSCLFVNDGSATVTTPSGWALLFTQESGSNARLSVFTKVAVGDEGGTTVDFETSGSEQAAAQVYRITDWEGSLSGVEAGTPVLNEDPPSLSPSWGAADTLWIAIASGDGGGDSQTVSSYPTNYTNGTATVTDSGTSGTRANCFSARRELNASSEDPGVFEFGGSDNRTTNTIAIRPAAAGEVVDGAAVLTGVGTLAAAALVHQLASTALSGLGALLASTEAELFRSFSDSFNESFDQLIVVEAAAALSGQGTLTVTAEEEAGVVEGSAVLMGAGALSVAALVEVLAAADLQGEGALEAVALLDVLAQVALFGEGGLSADAALLILAQAALTGLGALSAFSDTPDPVRVSRGGGFGFVPTGANAAELWQQRKQAIETLMHQRHQPRMPPRM